MVVSSRVRSDLVSGSNCVEKSWCIAYLAGTHIVTQPPSSGKKKVRIDDILYVKNEEVFCTTHFPCFRLDFSAINTSSAFSVITLPVVSS